MTDADVRGESVMAPAGYYNRHSSLQAAAAESGFGWLAEAAATVPLPEAGPVTVADYGVAQGANSMVPMGVVLDGLRARTDRPVHVVHTDLPGNDFAPLFELFAGDPTSYLRGRTDVYPYAIGRSFYRQLFPERTLHVGWSATTTHWLSHTPPIEVGHVNPVLNPPEIRDRFAEVAAADWVAFLEARAGELAPGGRVVMVEPTSQPGGSMGAEGFNGLLDEALARLVERGTITAEQRAAMVIPVCIRAPEEYAAPVDDVRGLHLIRHQVVAKPTNPLRVRFDETGDARAYAEAMAGSARGWSESMLFGGLPDGARVADEFFALVADLGAEDPARVHIETSDVLMELGRDG